MAEGFSPPEFNFGGPDTSFYEKLSIDQNACNKDFQKRFCNFAKIYHPDKTGEFSCEEAMKELNKMKSVLLDKVERKKYDEELSIEVDVNVPLFMRHNRGDILLPPVPRHSMEFIQLFNYSKEKFANLPELNFKNMIKELDHKLYALSALVGSSEKQTQKSEVKLRTKPLRSVYQEINIAANRYSTVDEVCDYESIKTILERIKKVPPSVSAGNPGDRAAILNIDCANKADLTTLLNLFLDDVPESASKPDLYTQLQKFIPVVTVESPPVPKHSRTECASCGSKPGWFSKKFNSCYWCNTPFCSSCPLEQHHYPRIGGTFHNLCSECTDYFSRADACEWAQFSIKLLTRADDDSISNCLGCASIAIALDADAHDLLGNIAKQLHSKMKHELAYTIVSLELSEDSSNASATQQMKAHLLASSILLSMAKLQNKSLDEKWNFALASKEAYCTAARIAIDTGTELLDNTMKEIDQIVLDLMKEKEQKDDLNVIQHTMALETLWSQRDIAGILIYLKENSTDTSENKDFLFKAFKLFLQNKEPHLAKMLPEDCHALEFLNAIIKIKEKNFKEAFQSIEATAWGHLTSSISDETIIGTCLHTVAEEETNLYSFISLKEILKAGSKTLLFSPPKMSLMSDRSMALLFPSESELTPPFEANWPSLSVVGHNTKCHTKYEDTVLKMFKDKKWSRLQVAWAYIDQFKGCDHPAEMTVCYLHAAMWIVSIFNTSKVDMKTFYGLKCVVMSLLQRSFSITFMTLNPGMELYVIRLIIGIMRKITQIPDSQFVLSVKDLNFLPILLIRLEKVSRLFPFWSPPKVSVSEAVIFNIITTKLHVNFMLALQDIQERSPVNSIDLSYQLYENDLRGMLPLNDPVDCRAGSMRELLNSQGWDWKDVTELMSSPLTQRDADGWIIQSKSLSVQQEYAEVNGFVLDLDPQNPSFKLLVVEANSQTSRMGLFSQEDLNTMLRLDSSDYPLFFSLDPPNDDLDKQYHPFQQWRYHTDSAKDTEVMHTMFITDYLMKSFTVGSDVSSMPPFKQRPCKEGLTKHLPQELQRAIRSIHERGGFHLQSHHRFWIEAKEMKYDLQQHGSKIECTFGEMEMIVKNHSLIRRNDGELKDTDEDDDPNSPESKFAEDMTNHYEELSLYFPQFARLRQLSKLQTVAIMLDSILQNVREKSEEKVQIPTEVICKEHYTQIYQAMTGIVCQYKSQCRQAPTPCKWVPAAICHESISYGGVSFAPKITPMEETERVYLPLNTISVSIQPKATVASKSAHSAISYTFPRGAMADKESGGQTSANINQTRKTVSDIFKGKPAQSFTGNPSNLRVVNSERLNAQLDKFARIIEAESVRNSTPSAGAERNRKTPTWMNSGPPVALLSEGQQWKTGSPPPRTIGIYKLTDKKSGKMYIGRSNDIARRHKVHQRNIRNSKKTVGKHFSSTKNVEIQYIELPNSCDSRTMQYHEQIHLNNARKMHRNDKVINIEDINASNAMSPENFEAMARELLQKYE